MMFDVSGLPYPRTVVCCPLRDFGTCLPGWKCCLDTRTIGADSPHRVSRFHMVLPSEIADRRAKSQFLRSALCAIVLPHTPHCDVQAPGWQPYPVKLPRGHVRVTERAAISLHRQQGVKGEFFCHLASDLLTRRSLRRSAAPSGTNRS